MPKQAMVYIMHKADECKFILNSCESISEQESFLNDEILKRAVVRSLEVIGEASKKIPAEFKNNWQNVNWKNMAGMRDKLIHDYMGINYYIVWDVIKNKIPELDKEISIIINSANAKSLF
jgi:uncharacterized protein with HEPN domain